jgi:UrcA family protein
MKHAFAWGSAALVAAGLFAAPAMAQSAADGAVKTTVAVHYHDIDLTTAKGRARLDWRMKRAAEQVCGYDRLERPWPGDGPAMACYDRALRDARTTFAARTGLREVVTR